MLVGNLESKSSSEERKAIKSKIQNWRKILEACKAENQLQVCYQCSPLRS